MVITGELDGVSVIPIYHWRANIGASLVRQQ
jgi:hypothetical protein